MSKRARRVLAGVVLLAALALAGCRVNVDGPQTPTVAVSPTLDETAIALLASDTPSPAPSATATRPPSATPTNTPTPTATPTATNTPTGTASPEPSATLTGTATLTATPTDTVTPSPTATATATSTDTPPPVPTNTLTLAPSATATPPPSATPTLAPSMTPTTSPTPTEAVEIAALPSETATLPPTPTSNATATAVSTPTPAGTPTPTATPSALPTLDPGEGGDTQPGVIATWTPSPTPAEAAGALPGEGGEGAAVDPNAPGPGQDAAPGAPEVPADGTGPDAPPLPEQQQVVVSYVGEVVPILSLVGVASAGGETYGQATIFDVSSTGQVATVGTDRWLSINGQAMSVSPASAGGVPPNLSIGAVAWSPDGRYVAFRVDDATPGSQALTDGGVWIYDMSAGANPPSWQVFRNGYPGQVAQTSDIRVATDLAWSPDGSRLAIGVTTRYDNVESGAGVVVINTAIDISNADLDPAAKAPLDVPFADATWTLDSAALIVSGAQAGGPTVVGRWDPATRIFTPYLDQAASGLAMQAAVELWQTDANGAPVPSGWIAFLGGPVAGRDVSLFVMPATPGAPIGQPASPVLSGEVVEVQWNPAHTAVMVMVRREDGDRLWLVRSDGTAQDITPPGGAPVSIDWR